MTARLQTIAVLAAAAALAGCGSDKTATVTQTVASTQPTTPTVATTPTTPTTPTVSVPEQPPTGQGGTLADAEVTLRDKGYRADDPHDYDSAATLRVLVGTRADSGDGYAKRAFFFVGGKFIG